MLPITVLSDGAFYPETGAMECSFAVYYGSVHCGLLLKHVSRAKVPSLGEKRPSSTRAEYAAALSGLAWVRAKIPMAEVTLWTDCDAVQRMANCGMLGNVKAMHYPSKAMKHSVIGH